MVVANIFLNMARKVVEYADHVIDFKCNVSVPENVARLLQTYVGNEWPINKQFFASTATLPDSELVQLTLVGSASVEKVLSLAGASNVEVRTAKPLPPLKRAKAVDFVDLTLTR